MASSSHPAYVILQRLPSPQDYHDLRKLAGMTPPPMEVVPQALASSFASFVVFERSHMLDDSTPAPDQRAVGMGRLIGDGALFLQLVDVAVLPEHQGKGLGRRIMETTNDYIDRHSPQAYVSLVAEPMGQGLYTQYGYEDTKPSIGMFRCPRIQNNADFRRLREEKAAARLRK